jgi:hypothetical protein
MSNYSFKPNTIPLGNDQTFTGDNFTQLVPHTKILEGYTGIVFNNCNLINCDLPVGAIKNSGVNYHLSFCSNLHPRWIEKGLSQCVENCSHVVSVDNITIDGQVVGTYYYYEDKVVT